MALLRWRLPSPQITAADDHRQGEDHGELGEEAETDGEAEAPPAAEIAVGHRHGGPGGHGVGGDHGDIGGGVGRTEKDQRCAVEQQIGDAGLAIAAAETADDRAAGSAR